MHTYSWHCARQVPLLFPVFIIFVALFLCLVPIITDPSPKYFIALVLVALGTAVYIPLVFYKVRPRWMGEYQGATARHKLSLPTSSASLSTVAYPKCLFSTTSPSFFLDAVLCLHLP